jgi:hypothetical protein
MKVIKYTLTSLGAVPEYVVDGGHVLVANTNPFPQNYDLIGIATDDAPEEAFLNKEDLLSYIEENNIEFTNSMRNETIPRQIVVDNIWAKLG